MMRSSFFLLLLVTAVKNVVVVVGSSSPNPGIGNTGPERKRHTYVNPNHHHEQQQQLSQQQKRRRTMDSSMFIISSSATTDEEGICSCSPTTIAFKLDLCQTCDDNTISDNTGLDGSFCFTETDVSLPGGNPLEEEEDKGESSRTTAATDEEVRYLQDKACAADEQHKYHSERINGRTRCTNGDADTTLDAADMFDSSEECCSATFKDVTNCVIVDICLPVVPTTTSSVLTTSSSSTGTNSDERSTGCNDDDNDPITEIISIQFLEFDTSGDLNVINQDNTYLSNISLTTGDTVSYTSISSYLDTTTSPLSYDSYNTNNSPPGGASLILYGKTASGSIVRNRFFWTYSLSCTNDNVPLVVGDSIGWVTVSEISNAWPVFCPALPSNTPTITPGLTTAPTEVFPTSMPTPTVTGESTPHGTDDGNNNIDNTMCSFCDPDGVEFPDQILPTDDGTTCTIASEYAATLMANDVMCPTVLMAEALCCPNNSGGGGGTDDEPQPEPCEGNIVDVAIENQDFTTLVAAVTAAGLVDELSGEGPFTIFAPTNDAFDAIPTKLLNLLLLPENIKKLQGIILYHALSGSYPSSDLTSGDRFTLPTINGESVTISVNDAGGVMVNDANVIQTDIIACNGIIHVIDLVLLPPGDEGTFGPDIGDDDEMMSMPRSKAALEDWSQAEKDYFLQNFAL